MAKQRWTRGASGNWEFDLGRLGRVVIKGGNGGGFYAHFLDQTAGPFTEIDNAKAGGLRLVQEIVSEAAKVLLESR